MPKGGRTPDCSGATDVNSVCVGCAKRPTITVGCTAPLYATYTVRPMCTRKAENSNTSLRIKAQRRSQTRALAHRLTPELLSGPPTLVSCTIQGRPKGRTHIIAEPRDQRSQRRRPPWLEYELLEEPIGGGSGASGRTDRCFDWIATRVAVEFSPPADRSGLPAWKGSVGESVVVSDTRS